MAKINIKTHNHPLVKSAKSSSGIQGTAHLSQRDAYAKFLNMSKTKNAKSYGVGWGK